MRSKGDQGAINALMDEYAKALDELYAEIKDLSPEQLTKVVDHETEDEDCRSIRTILHHVLQSGYAYVVEIDKYGGGSSKRQERPVSESSGEYITALKEMHQSNAAFFEKRQDIPLYEKDNAKKLVTRWGQSYDVDQLLEHAVMHIHRHRRQIVNFKKLL